MRQFGKTNAFEQTVEFCIWMKTSFSSVVTPFPQINVAKRFVDVHLFSTLNKGGMGAYLSWVERAEFAPRKKVGNFHVSCLHDCDSRTLETRYWKFDTFDRELNSDQHKTCLGMRCQQSLVASWNAFFVQAISCCTLWSEDSDASICNMAVGPCSFRPRTTHGNNEDKRNTYFTKLYHPGQFVKHWGHYCCY